MHSIAFHFLDGQSYPRCTAQVDAVFGDYYAVQFMGSGSMDFRRNASASVRWNTPTFFWTDRVTRYRYGPGPTCSWAHNWVTFAGETADQYYAPLLRALAPKGYLPVPDPEEIGGAFSALILSLIHI